MDSIRKWFYKPKRDDQSLLAQFFYADEALNLVAAELDSFDGRKDPERCTALVNHLRQCQDKVLTICNRIMDDIIPFDRADRDFRVKFPDDVMQENLAGQLWFGAECLAAGSSIMNREAESARMRPLAKAVTRALENVRNLLRERCLRGGGPADPERLTESLKILDRLFAEFELSYVSAMVPVKTCREYELHQLVVVLFSETLHRALEMQLLTRDMVAAYDPALMFAVPRLAIVSGLLVFPDGPLCLDRTPHDMSEMFRPFRTLLNKIRELLWTLDRRELYTLERMLGSAGGADLAGVTDNAYRVPDLDEFVTRFYIDYPSCKQFVSDFYSSADEGGLASWEDSDSEDETEWAGEASECDTIVAGRSAEGSVVTATPLASLGGSMETGELDVETPAESESVETNAEDDVFTVTRRLSESADVENGNVNRPDVVLNEGSASSNPASPMEESGSDGSNPGEAFKLETRELARLIGELLSHEAETNQSGDSLTPSTSSPPSEMCSGFLLANKMAPAPLLDDGDQPPSCAESLPDGDCREAMSVVTATLSTLLLSDLDAGLGTVPGSGESPPDRNPGANPERSPPRSSKDFDEASGNEEDRRTIAFSRSNGSDDFVDSDSVHSPHNNSIDSDSVLSPRNNTTHLINISNDDITQVTSVLNTVPAGNVAVDSYEDLTIPLDGATVPRHFRNIDVESSEGSERSKPRETTAKCVSAARKSSAVGSHRGDNHNFNDPDAMRAKSHAYHKDVPKSGGNISTNRSKTIEGCSKGRSVRGGFYRKGFRGQTSDRGYSLNWDSLVRQHSKVPPRGRNRLRRSPNDVVSNLAIADESESSHSSTCSSCRGSLTAGSLSDGCSVSSETSSFNSECQDDEEIALAMQAAEIANRNEVRAKFRSSEDLVHRLFVCVAGVADQLQTNFAGDLRHILKCVFMIHNSTEEEEEERLEEEPLEGNTTTANDSCRTVDSAEEALGWGTSPNESPEVESPPPWVPDDLAPRCMACESVFTVVRRRHHCRNCGKVFCARCSSNSVALPRYGHAKPVRVCNRCFLYQVTPFTIDQVAVHS